MAREPHYPNDNPVGSTGAGETPRGEAATAAAGAKSVEGGRKKHLVTGAAIGIGSAAIVAALLYAKSRTRNDRS